MKESFVMILLLIIVPTILPFFIIMIAGNLKYNKKKKTYNAFIYKKPVIQPVLVRKKKKLK